MAKAVTPDQLKGLLRAGGELAVVDVREQGVFATGHLLQACSIPLSRLELRFADLVPRLGVPIVLCDQGPADTDELAGRAAARLAGFGYDDVAVLDGGVDGWRAGGFELFSGVNVPSKAFAEFVEHAYDTPRLTADQVKAKLAVGDDMVVLDSRPFDEYRRMSIPGGIDVPGAELVYRVHDVAPDPATLVVVNCAGRTRSIIGAQSLINAGIPNRVAALKDGTMGWHLAGHQLEHDQDRRAPMPTVAGLAEAKAAAARVAARFGVQGVDRATLEAWRAERQRRSLFLLDVRSPEEYAAGHLAGARHAPGGQLVQATDEYVATRGARIVLVDDTEVRATMTASWLLQMGWTEVYVLSGGIADQPVVAGPSPRTLLPFDRGETISPIELGKALESGEPIAVVDLATSLAYRSGHIPGAWWGVRARLDRGLAQLAQVGLLVLTSPDGTLAHLAVPDANAACPGMPVRVLDGGTDAWVAAGLATADGLERPMSQADDVWYRPYEHQGAVEQWMQDYLSWEVALVAQIERDGDANFRRFV